MNLFFLPEDTAVQAYGERFMADRVLPQSGSTGQAQQTSRKEYGNLDGLNLVFIIAFACAIAFLAQRLARRGGRK